MIINTEKEDICEQNAKNNSFYEGAICAVECTIGSSIWIACPWFTMQESGTQSL